MAKDKSMGNSHTAGWKILKGNTKKWSKSLEKKYFTFFKFNNGGKARISEVLLEM